MAPYAPIHHYWTTLLCYHSLELCMAYIVFAVTVPGDPRSDCPFFQLLLSVSFKISLQVECTQENYQ